MDVPPDPEGHPRVNASPGHALFYVVFVVVGSFFVMNIFVGVVVHKFQVAKERTNGASIFLTEHQRAFVDRARIVLDAGRPNRLRVPPQAWRQRGVFVVVSETFEIAIIAAIVLNMVFLSLNHYGQGPAWDLVDLYSNAAFTAAFGFALVLKVVGLGPRQYYNDGWNKFDATIVGARRLLILEDCGTARPRSSVDTDSHTTSTGGLLHRGRRGVLGPPLVRALLVPGLAGDPRGQARAREPGPQGPPAGAGGVAAGARQRR